MRTVITKEKAIKDIRAIFNIDDNDIFNGYETKGKFGVNKQSFERFEVISKLQEYFIDKMFEKGLGLKVGSITLVYTDFKIIEIQ